MSALKQPKEVEVPMSFIYLLEYGDSRIIKLLDLTQLVLLSIPFLQAEGFGERDYHTTRCHQ
jgi:hypothetical protein